MYQGFIMVLSLVHIFLHFVAVKLIFLMYRSLGTEHGLCQVPDFYIFNLKELGEHGLCQVPDFYIFNLKELGEHGLCQVPDFYLCLI